jgi:hypothetical protein
MGDVDDDRHALHAAGVPHRERGGPRRGQHRDPGQRERSPQAHAFIVATDLVRTM